MPRSIGLAQRMQKKVDEPCVAHGVAGVVGPEVNVVRRRP